MPFNRIASYFSVCLIAAAGLSAGAADDLGSVLDGGGKKLSADEFKSEMVGKNVGGQGTNGPWRREHRADGALGGSLVGRRGEPWQINGNWTVDDAGKVCVKFTYSPRKLEEAFCTFYFKQGDQYFASRSDSDRSQKAIPVQVQ